VKWNPVPVNLPTPEATKDAMRLNSLGSLFFFAREVLMKKRFARLHVEMCRSLETEDLHLVLEMPMSHFKSTCGLALSIWWALPFTDRDELLMRGLGYGDEWIRWMRFAHKQNMRTLVTHETDARVTAMGKEVDEAYQSNDRFRALFPEIIPTGKETWTEHTKYQRRIPGGDVTTGTYEYRSVGQPLQGIHVGGIIEDDTMGKDAQDSMLKGDGRVLADLIRWHRQVGTRFDPSEFTTTGLGRQLVIGNRWGHQDLNSWIKANQPEFKFETHSAEGGCCPRHPKNQPIFPEEWTMERLQQQKKTSGPYDYAHFYLNQSVLPEECIFKPEWLRYFKYKPSRPDLPLEHEDNWLMIEHEVQNGETIQDVNAGVLEKRMIVDLAHAKKQKRCNHVVLIAGRDPETERIYLLDVWAEPTQYSDLVGKIYEMGRRWGMREMWLETVAAQNLMKFYLEERNMRETRPIQVNELPYDNSPNAKRNRIEVLEPMFKNGNFFCHRSQSAFLNEYNSYPAGLMDVLDTLGYVPQTFRVMNMRSAMEWFSRQRDTFASRPVGAGGY